MLIYEFRALLLFTGQLLGGAHMENVVGFGESLWEHPLATGHLNRLRCTEESLSLSSGPLQSSWEIREKCLQSKGRVPPQGLLGQHLGQTSASLRGDWPCYLSL